MQHLLAPLASSEASFFDATFLYIAGGLLVVLALVVAFAGMRREEDFPNAMQMRTIGGVAAILVLATGAGAVLSARFEQSERRAENEEAAREELERTEGNEAALGPQGEAEAADPESGTGATPAEPDTQSEEPPASASVAGRELFITNGCGSCHTLGDAGSEGTVGPVLDDTLAGQSPEMIRTSIEDPGAKVVQGFPAGTMPTNYGDVLSEGDLDQLARYLAQQANG